MRLTFQPQAMYLERQPLHFEGDFRMRTKQQHRSGLSKSAFVFGSVLWLAVLLVIVNRVLTRSDNGHIEKSSQSDSSEAVESRDSVELDKSSEVTPGAIVLQPSDNSIHIGFPTQELPDFEFEESMGGKVSRDSLKGHPWVASFVFTRCVTTCPVISRQMMELHKRIAKSNPEIRFVTFSVDPKYDTPEVLKGYSEIFTADHERWKFLTGDETKVHDLIRDGFAQVVIPNVGDERKPGFEVAHSNRVVLVNENAVPVATYLATRDEDVVKLRRVLEGKEPFPEPAPISGLTFSNSAQAPINIEIRKADNDQNESSDSSDETPPSDAASEETIIDPPPVDAAPAGETIDSDVSERSTAENAFDSSAPNTNAVVASGKGASRMTGQLLGLYGVSPAMLTSLALETADTSPTRPALANDKIDQLLPPWAARLPRLNALLNSISTVLLLLGFLAIRGKRRSVHRNLMVAAFLVSVAFLCSYLSYHYALGEYTGERGRQFVGSHFATLMYRSILIPHVILAIFVPVLAIRVFQHAFTGRWDQHRRLARITFPIWLFVSVTGVLIYWMLYEWPWRTVEGVQP